MTAIVLTVSPKSGGKSCAYRLRANKRDNAKVSLFADGDPVTMIVQGAPIYLTSRNTEKCPDELDSLNGVLNVWIRRNSFHIYRPGKPTRLRFNLESVMGNTRISFNGPV